MRRPGHYIIYSKTLSSFVHKYCTRLGTTMSSLRNSLHRRNHKERSQLSHRQRFGILEKHKDYVLRARDYHSKQDRVKRLRQKAADRNKDEFYFGMNRERTEVCGLHALLDGDSVDVWHAFRMVCMCRIGGMLASQ